MRILLTAVFRLLRRIQGARAFAGPTAWLAFWLGLSLAFPATAEVAKILPVPADPAAALHVPPGFQIRVFARLEPAGAHYFRGPRFMAFGPDGNLYLSLGMENRVVMLPDRDRDGRADSVVTVYDGLNAPQGLVFSGGDLLVANQDGVVMLEKPERGWPAAGVSPVIRDLPSGGHTMKSLKLGPDGYLYMNVGSSCNVCTESSSLRATLLRFTLDGKPAGMPKDGGGKSSPVWTEGLRNAQGFAWSPVGGALYATNDGPDMRSDAKGGAPNDDVPPERLNRIEAGKHYGWPYCLNPQVPDPNFPGPENFCKGTEPAAITFPAHSTPIGMTFLEKAAFPQEYRNDALVALHGSWNRRDPSGYKVVRVRFRNGSPVAVSDFVTGWLDADGAWGRPVDVAVGPDGAVYLSDERAGLVYRINYRKETIK